MQTSYLPPAVWNEQEMAGFSQPKMSTGMAAAGAALKGRDFIRARSNQNRHKKNQKKDRNEMTRATAAEKKRTPTLFNPPELKDRCGFSRFSFPAAPPFFIGEFEHKTSEGVRLSQKRRMNDRIKRKLIFFYRARPVGEKGKVGSGRVLILRQAKEIN